MLVIDDANAEDYLRHSGRLTPAECVTVRELTGGVSNVVLLVSRPSGEPLFVLKQAREQLRVPDPWFCSMERIWREVAVLEICHRVLEDCDGVGRPAPNSRDGVGRPAPNSCDGVRSADPPRGVEPTVAVPRVLFVDRENYLYAMTAAPQHEVWKTQLLRGETDSATAGACGRLLGALHAATWRKGEIAETLNDTSFFHALRVDPYYRHVALRFPDIAPRIEDLIQSLADHRRCLVHGDFSPKNILIHKGGLTLVDFEVGHFGDPAFDLGFILSHLVLKAIRAGTAWWDYLRLTFVFWNGYGQQMLPVCRDLEYAALIGRGIANFAGCLLARVEGKSRVEYLDPPAQDVARRLARRLLLHPVLTWPEVTACFVKENSIVPHPKRTSP